MKLSEIDQFPLINQELINSKEYLTQKRRARKIALTEHLGSRCLICGESELACLVFHHINPNTKKFGIGSNMLRSWEEVRAEAEHCILLCANCHARVHAGNYPEYLVQSDG